MTKNKFYKALAGSVALCALTTGTAFAGGTAPGEIVDNTFTLDYTVGTTPQTQITNAATPTTFTVDRLVNLTVANEGATTENVDPNGQNEELLFSLTNTGNDTQGYALSTAVVSTTMANNPNLTVHYYIDDGDGAYDPGVGEDGALIDYDASNPPQLGPDAVLWVVVRGDIDAGVSDGQNAVINLVADTLVAGGTTEAIDDGDTANGGDDTNQINGTDTVLLDAAGTDDNANEGDHSAQGTYLVAAADVAADKTVSVFSTDGSNCSDFSATAPTDEQYTVPGACVEYTISATNTGGAPATAITIVDDLFGKELTFIAADFTGFTTGAFDASTPTSSVNCETTTVTTACEIVFENGTLPATTGAGSVRIRALVN